MDRSRRFLDALESTRAQRGLEQLAVHELDLDLGELPAVSADGAWCRWVFAFLKRPRDLLTRVASRLKPGGVLVSHEYFDYSTWRVTPRSPELEEFVSVVMESWRADGGEPDIGLDLPLWLPELGFEIQSLQPLVDVVRTSSFQWQWPAAFIDVGLRRLVDIGRLTPERARQMAEAFAAHQKHPHGLMITPAVLEIIAVRRLIRLRRAQGQGLPLRYTFSMRAAPSPPMRRRTLRSSNRGVSVPSGTKYSSTPNE
jgi:SAM-dependent methyltransferase